jgi:hypothetical protein
MNSRKTGPGSEMNITLTMIWCQVVIQLVHMCTFLLNFDIDNCLLKKFHYRCTNVIRRDYFLNYVKSQKRNLNGTP